MQFSEILGQEHIKSHLTKSANLGRIPHAQLFVGPEGSGTLAMAIAYAQYIICSNQNAENSGSNEACNLKFNKISHPDLHFIYPTVSTEEVKTKPKSIDFITEWRQFLSENLYGSLFDWYQILALKINRAKLESTMHRKY